MGRGGGPEGAALLREACDAFRVVLERAWEHSAALSRRELVRLLTGLPEGLREAARVEVGRLEGAGEVSEFTTEYVREQMEALQHSLRFLFALVGDARVGKLVAMLQRHCEMLTMYSEVDEDAEFHRVTAVVRGVRKRLDCERGSLERALMALFVDSPSKPCRVCAVIKPLDQFSKLASRDHKDGRNNRCKQCERERVQRATEAKKKREEGEKNE